MEIAGTLAFLAVFLFVGWLQFKANDRKKLAKDEFKKSFNNFLAYYRKFGNLKNIPYQLSCDQYHQINNEKYC